MIEGSVNEPQLDLFPDYTETAKPDLSSTFADNMSLPVHRWFRYTAGFSASWVKEVLDEEACSHVLDPFAGSGTVLLESEFAGIDSIGVEAHPYVYRIARAKLDWHIDPALFKNSAKELLAEARKKNITTTIYPKLIEKCYPLETANKLEALKQAWGELECDESLKQFHWFTITSILRISSPVGTAQWQYVLPNKTKSRYIDPFLAFEAKVQELCQDMINMQTKYPSYSKALLLREDARSMPSVPNGWADLVITSPPYANNYDYADATRLEMTFWGDITSWGDLQDKVRQHLITACTQHVGNVKDQAFTLLHDPILATIMPELADIYKLLDEVRLTKGGKKNYHLMVLAYFHDLARVFHELRRVTSPNCKMCFVIGDSAPYGVYLPVDKWLGELALSAGFSSYSFEKLRDRNTKWKNRKHRVPLQEGRLWIKG